jgi:hypothetical protein
MSKPKRIRADIKVGRNPKPKSIPLPKDQRIDSQNPLWSFRMLDMGGPWCWGVMDQQTFMRVLDRLRNLESMTWVEITNTTGSHFIEMDKLNKDAISRIADLKYDDIDELYSLRITGQERIFGIRYGRDHVLRILWWDPKHQVCPSPKKHT